MIVHLIESDKPKLAMDWLSQLLARPPQPILRFFGDFKRDGNTLTFAIRNGVPLPLLYGVYVEADGDYAEATDSMLPFSVDTWRVEFDVMPASVDIRVGLVPVEFQTDRRKIAL